MKGFSLAHFNIQKYYLILFFALSIACKQKETNKIKAHDIQRTNFITDSILNNKMIKFIKKHTLDNTYKQVYLISFNLINKDTLLTIRKTFMPQIYNKKMKYKGGTYLNNYPVLIIDLLPSIGHKYYDYTYLNDSIIEKYRSIKHPTYFRKIMKSEKYLIRNGNWMLISEN